MSNDEIRNTDNTNKAKSSKWEGPEPEKNKWEGPEPSKSEAGIPKRNATGGNSPVVSNKKSGNKVLPVIIAVIATAFWGLVVIVIASFIWGKLHDSSVNTTVASDYTSSNDDNYNSDEDTEEREETIENESGESEESESGESEESDSGNSGTGHIIQLDEDPVPNPLSGFNSVSSTSDAFHGYGFAYDGDVLTYNDNDFTSRFGIDVSHYQGKIDWHKVREAGVTFAFIRLGYRGYGEEGNIGLDDQFEYNLENAMAEGIDVGVYFFSQALNEDEAREEADFVISTLESYGFDDQTGIKLPVAYDLITATDMGGRTNGLTLEQYASNAQAFCRTMSQASYQTTIAFNEDQRSDFGNELDSLSLYSFWYGNYNITDQVVPPFTFDFMQFSNKGKIPGIDTPVDLDIQILRR